ncbi:MAG: YggS family pyridoxal phosphate-dependent enzyme [Alistipes sp.]
MAVNCELSNVKSTLPEGVTLIAVSKTHPVEAIMEAYDAGQRLFGENRPQELVAKYELLPKNIEWHMIGHLQTNKVRAIAPFVAMIHSVDSVRLVETIQKEAARCERKIQILFEIHVADEASKSGWAFDELLQYVRTMALAQMPNVQVRGVMGVATNTADEERVRQDFETLKRDFDLLQPLFGARFDTLSMGMSHDYPLAVACGATMVRVGSLIFGERDYSLVK